MKHFTFGVGVVLLSGLMAAPASAQVWGSQSRNRNQGIPPGHMPPAGMCRVWYDGVPPGQQPGPIACRDAERIASRSRDARVIYGRDGRDGRDGRGNRRDPYGDRNGNGGWRTDPWGTDPWGVGGSRNRRSDRTAGYNDAPFRNGYSDGYDKGREDARDGDSYDPVRHSRYRSADRGYNSRYGNRDQYKLVYRDGFEAGYAEGYRDARGNRSGNPRGGINLPWPF